MSQFSRYQKVRTSWWLIAYFILGMAGCGSESTTSENEQVRAKPDDVPRVNAAIPDNRFAVQYKVLLFGNSHVSGQASLLKTLLELGNPNAKVTVANGGGGFLDNESSRANRTARLAEDGWTHLILQGQKYSMSGRVSYPTDAAQNWIALAKAQSATPILFPEHPRRNNTEEGRRVHNLHLDIVEDEKACVAPVGLAWDEALLIRPALPLHAADGNHASPVGSLLTALVFYEVISGQSADLLPYIPDLGINQITQDFLGQTASRTLDSNPPCAF